VIDSQNLVIDSQNLVIDSLTLMEVLTVIKSPARELFLGERVITRIAGQRQAKRIFSDERARDELLGLGVQRRLRQGAVRYFRLNSFTFACRALK
jgi:hypothetical protein